MPQIESWLSRIVNLRSSTNIDPNLLSPSEKRKFVLDGILPLAVVVNRDADSIKEVIKTANDDVVRYKLRKKFGAIHPFIPFNPRSLVIASRKCKSFFDPHPSRRGSYEQWVSTSANLVLTVNYWQDSSIELNYQTGRACYFGYLQSGDENTFPLNSTELTKKMEERTSSWNAPHLIIEELGPLLNDRDLLLAQYSKNLELAKSRLEKVV